MCRRTHTRTLAKSSGIVYGVILRRRRLADPSYVSVVFAGLDLVAAGGAGTRLLWRWRRPGRRWLWRWRPRRRRRRRRRRWLGGRRAVVEALVAAALQAHHFLVAKGWVAEAVGGDALVVAEGRQVLEALAEAPVLALAAGDGSDDDVGGALGVAGDDVVKGVLVAAVPRARLEALPVVHVLVVHRHRHRCRREERGDSQDDAERPALRFVARHHWLASYYYLSCSVVLLGTVS
uniref:Uncharacterized protein n=1 Tax=Zea mays TaxID=4577 RepID=C4J6H6_MAIZE|nr:unknown [Zea mays]